MKKNEIEGLALSDYKALVIKILIIGVKLDKLMKLCIQKWTQHISVNHYFDKDTKAISEERISCQQMVSKQLDFQGLRGIPLAPYENSFKNIIKLLEENIERNLCNLGISKNI